MMSPKMAPPGFLKIKVFWKKGYDIIILSMKLPAKFYHVIKIILKMWSIEQSLLTVAFLWEKLS